MAEQTPIASVLFVTLGCAKNEVDTDRMRALLLKAGFSEAADPEEADVAIVNTCSFLASATEESVEATLELAEGRAEGVRECPIVMCGCVPSRYGDELPEQLPEVAAFVRSEDEDGIVGVVADVLGVQADLAPVDFSGTLRTIDGASSFVKISEGCDRFCAFCAIPYIRGDYRSRRIEDICDEVRHLTENGVREVVLIAQDSTEYGRDLYGAPKLSELLREIVKVPKLQWVRTLYSYPKYFSDELIETIASEPKICKYVDLPLQHAHDAVLRSMRRPDTQEEMRALIKKLRERIPGVTIRSTFIVGFPGETDAQYHTLRNFIEEMRLDKVGVFTYSREEGTPAYDMPNQVPEEIMQERYHDLMSLQCKISEQINQSLEGKELDVLVEGRDEEQPNISVGRSYREAPEVDGQVYVENDTDSKPGDIVHVRVLQGFTYDIVGERINNGDASEAGKKAAE